MKWSPWCHHHLKLTFLFHSFLSILGYVLTCLLIDRRNNCNSFISWFYFPSTYYFCGSYGELKLREELCWCRRKNHWQGIHEIYTKSVFCMAGGTCNNVSTWCKQIVLQAGTKFDCWGPVHRKGVGTWKLCESSSYGGMLSQIALLILKCNCDCVAIPFGEHLLCNW